MGRRGIELAIGAVIGLLMARCWLAVGVVVPMRVVGPSMAERLLGPHRRVTCAVCQFPFVCDARAPYDRATPVCPHCGSLQPPSEEAPRFPGDRFWVDRLTYAVRAPRRWELVVFRCPAEPSQVCVKRIVGLPGETVQICDGDVWIDERPAHKSLARLRRMAVGVHDTRYAFGAAGLPRRWRADASSTAWVADGTEWSFRAPANRDAEGVNPNAPAWLRYRHWRRDKHDPPQTVPAAVDDNCGYNPALSRPLNRVRDLVLIARLRAAGAGELTFSIDDRGSVWSCQFESARDTGQVLLDGEPIATVPLDGILFDRLVTVEFGLLDQQLVLAIDGRSVVQQDVTSRREMGPWPVRAPHGPGAHATDPKTPARREGPAVLPDRVTREQPLAIGAANLDIQIDRLQVVRDIFYTDRQHRDCSARFQLGPDEFFVLGDNSPISRDSRHCETDGALRSSLLIGKPIDWGASRTLDSDRSGIRKNSDPSDFDRAGDSIIGHLRTAGGCVPQNFRQGVQCGLPTCFRKMFPELRQSDGRILRQIGRGGAR